MNELFSALDEGSIVIIPCLWGKKLRLKEASALPTVKQPGRPSQGRVEEAKDKLGSHTSFALGNPARPVQPEGTRIQRTFLKYSRVSL